MPTLSQLPMRILYILVVSIIVFPLFVSAQKLDEFKKPRILILLDGSSSMVNDWMPPKTRFQTASDIIIRLMDSIYQSNKDVEFSLRVFGHQHHVPENNCLDTRNEVMFTKDNLTQMELRLASLRPKGVSPIAYSLKIAAENDFVQERDYAYSLILITDGAESCGGDICLVVQSLLQKKIQFRPYIISLVDYAPLQEQYNCLGTYLQASKPEEVTTTINTIAEGYRKLLATPIVKPKPEVPVVVPKPTIIKKPTVAVKIPPKDTVEDKPVNMSLPLPVVDNKKVAISVGQAKIETIKTNSKIKIDTASIPMPEQISAIPMRKSQRLFAVYWVTGNPKKRPQNIPLKIPARQADTVKTVIATTTVKPLNTANQKPIKQQVGVANAIKQEDKVTQYTISKEASKETTLQVFFTNGKGKFFTTSPRLILVDPKTNATVFRFFRTVDATGNPDPVKVPVGTYDLRFESNPALVSKAVTIVEQMNQRLVIVVHNSGLQFRYENNEKRPVKEYVATVKKLFENTPVAQHPCDKIIEYEPGNYHIEIPGTMPRKRFNLDIDFDKIFTVDIAEDGVLQFTNTNPVGKVMLFYQDGDRMEYFHTMNLNGQVENQQIRLQPGPYEARYKGGIQSFVVKSNNTVNVELK